MIVLKGTAFGDLKPGTFFRIDGTNAADIMFKNSTDLTVVINLSKANSGPMAATQICYPFIGDVVFTLS